MKKTNGQKKNKKKREITVEKCKKIIKIMEKSGNKD